MEDILKNIKANLIKAHPRGYVLDKKNANEVTDWIDTGNYNLNMAVSGSFFNGIPNNTITGLVGDSGVGKTFILLNIYRSALKKGYTIYHFDTEGAINKTLLEQFGMLDYLNKDKIIIIPVGIIEDMVHLFHQIMDPISEAAKKNKGIDKLPKTLIGIDSVGNLASRKEFTDSSKGDEKVDMTAAKKLNSFFRQITEPCSTLKLPVIITNHVYVTQDFIPEVKLKKGNGMTYSASNIIMFRKAQLKDGTNKVGLTVTAVPMKNRFVQPIPVKFHIRFAKGMNRYVGLDEYIKNPTDWNLQYKDIGVGMGKLDKEGNFVPSKNNNGFYVESLGKSVKQASKVFSSKTFTDEVLHKMNEKIAPFYQYAKASDQDVDEELDKMTNEE